VLLEKQGLKVKLVLQANGVLKAKQVLKVKLVQLVIKAHLESKVLKVTKAHLARLEK